jgi:hypothetical protein
MTSEAREEAAESRAQQSSSLAVNAEQRSRRLATENGAAALGSTVLHGAGDEVGACVSSARSSWREPMSDTP